MATEKLTVDWEKLNKLVQEVRDEGYVSGAGAVPGGSPRQVDRTIMELLCAILKGE